MHLCLCLIVAIIDWRDKVTVFLSSSGCKCYKRSQSFTKESSLYPSQNRLVIVLQCLLMFCSIGRVCVPIDVERIDDFDPFQVPTVSQLCYEFETAGTNKGKKGTFTVNASL